MLNVDSDAQFEFVHLNDNRIMRVYDDNGKKLWEINNPSGGVARDGGHSPAVVTWDFDGDGRDDIVHCWTNKLTIRVGATGAVMHSVPIRTYALTSISTPI